MAIQVRRLYAEIVIETDEKDMPKMSNWVVSRLKSSVDMSDHGAIAIAVLDEEEVVLGQNVVGQIQTLSPAELFDQAS
jgi:hypothetical protein